MKRFSIVAGLLLTLLFTGIFQSSANGLSNRVQTVAADSIQQAAADSIRQAELETAIRNIVQSELARQEHSRHSTFAESCDTILGKSVEILAVASPFVMITLIVFFVIAGNTKRRRIKYDMVEKAIDKGYQIPEYVFYEKQKEKMEKSPLNTAITLIAVGIAVSMFFLFNGDAEIAALTSMIMLMGIGKLIVYILDERQKRKFINRHTEINNIHNDAEQD